jgi:hypothetical protein
MVVPLEDEISKATTKLFPQLEHAYSPLAEKLKSMDLPGAVRLENLAQDIQDILFNDASDATQRLGGEDSTLYANLKWASQLKQALSQGLEDTLRQLQKHRSQIEGLPDSGIPGNLKNEVSEVLTQLRERLNTPDFFADSTYFASTLTQLKTSAMRAFEKMEEEQLKRIQSAEQDLQRISEWKELTVQEQNDLLADLENLKCDVNNDLNGLKELVNQEYCLQNQLQDLKQRVQRIGQERLQEKIQAEHQEGKTTGKQKIARRVNHQRCITNISALDELISQLQKMRGELQFAHEFELTLDISEETGD